MAKYFLDPKTSSLIRINEPKKKVDLSAEVASLIEKISGIENPSASQLLEMVDGFASDVRSMVQFDSRILECIKNGFVELKTEQVAANK